VQVAHCVHSQFSHILVFFQGLIILTGGQWPAQYSAVWKGAAQSMFNQQITTYAINVGDESNRPMMETAVKESGYIFTPASYPALRGERERVVRTIVFGRKFPSKQFFVY